LRFLFGGEQGLAGTGQGCGADGHRSKADGAPKPSYHWHCELSHVQWIKRSKEDAGWN
jgi:hypothetical protein